MSKATLLTRAERADVLQRCLKNRLLVHRCYRCHRLLDTSPEDLLEDLAVKMYTELFKFRFINQYTDGPVDPLQRAFKLALTTGHNALTSMIRTALKRERFVQQDIDLTTIKSNAISNTNVKEVLEVMATVATTMVGEANAGTLVRATLYDWERHRGKALTHAQLQLLKSLGLRDRRAAAQLIEKFHALVREQFPVQSQADLRKVNGVWQATIGATGTED